MQIAGLNVTDPVRLWMAVLLLAALAADMIWPNLFYRLQNFGDRGIDGPDDMYRRWQIVMRTLMGVIAAFLAVTALR